MDANAGMSSATLLTLMRPIPALIGVSAAATRESDESCSETAAMAAYTLLRNSRTTGGSCVPRMGGAMLHTARIWRAPARPWPDTPAKRNRRSMPSATPERGHERSAE